VQFFLGVIPTAQAGGLVWGIKEQCAEKARQNSFYQEESYRWSGGCAFAESAIEICDHSTSIHNPRGTGPIRCKEVRMPVLFNANVRCDRPQKNDSTSDMARLYRSDSWRTR